jgi:hypothetical protein
MTEPERFGFWVEKAGRFQLPDLKGLLEFT